MSKHLLIINYVRKWAAIEVPRCGCSLLKSLVLKDHFPDKYEELKDDPHGIHEFFGYTPESSQGHIQYCTYATPGYRRFAVWRNPIERLFSLWAEFCQGSHEHAPFVYGGIRGLWFADFVDYVEWAMKSPQSLPHDPHTQRQVDLYGPDDVDDIVPISSLQQYLTQFGHDNVPHVNVTKYPFRLSYSDYPALEKAARLYAADFSIPYWGKTP